MTYVEAPRSVVGTRHALRVLDPSKDHRPFDRLVTSSLPELRPWLPWALDEPLSKEARTDQLKNLRFFHDAGENLIWGIRSWGRMGEKLVGGVGLHRTEGDTWMVGYWVGSRHGGRGHATWAAAVVARLALEELGHQVVEVRVAENNTPSLVVASRLTLRPSKTISLAPEAPGETGPVRVYTITQDDLVTLRMLTGNTTTIW